MNHDDKYKMSSLANAFALLDIVAEHDGIGVSELCRLSGQNKTSVFKMLYTMERCGYITKTHDVKYKLSMKFAHYGSIVLDRIDLVSAARPYLSRLRDAVNETVHLTIPSSDFHNVIIIRKEFESSSMRMGSRIGKMLPSHCSATGKAILAGQKDKFLDSLLDELNYIPYTAMTISNKNDLWKEIQKVREAGVAIDSGETEEDLVCVAAPITDIYANTIGAVSISGPKTRMNQNLDACLAAVKETAKNISQQMGA